MGCGCGYGTKQIKLDRYYKLLLPRSGMNHFSIMFGTTRAQLEGEKVQMLMEKREYYPAGIYISNGNNLQRTRNFRTF